MGNCADAVDRISNDTGFSGVVRVDRGDTTEFVRPYGLAHRGWGIANDIGTLFPLASGTKGLTALTVMTLIEEGRLELATPVRPLLADDLPLVADDVTVEHLLAHRSGIGDYLDEDTGGAVTDHVLPIAVHPLATTEQYLAVLAGHPPKFPAGERFSYCNSGYVVLALLAERVTGTPFHDLVEQRVCTPAQMCSTGFLRSDEPAGNAALDYLSADGLRTNVLRLPVRGSGDGGIYSTVADIHALWYAMFAGRIVPPRSISQMVRPHSEMPSSMAYGLGFWIDPRREAVMLMGSDAGVSFRSVRDPAAHLVYTVMSNTTDGAWPIARHLDEALTA